MEPEVSSTTAEDAGGLYVLLPTPGGTGNVRRGALPAAHPGVGLLGLRRGEVFVKPYGQFDGFFQKVLKYLGNNHQSDVN